MAGYGILPVTKSVTLLGDSPVWHSRVFSILVTPGAASSLPADVQVPNRAVGGEGIGAANLISELGLSGNTFPATSTLHNDYKFGGGKTTLSF